MGQNERGRLGQPLASRKPPVDLKGLGASLCLLVLVLIPKAVPWVTGSPLAAHHSFPASGLPDPASGSHEPAGSALFFTSGLIADPAELRLR